MAYVSPRTPAANTIDSSDVGEGMVGAPDGRASGGTSPMFGNSGRSASMGENLRRSMDSLGGASATSDLETQQLCPKSPNKKRLVGQLAHFNIEPRPLTAGK